MTAGTDLQLARPSREDFTPRALPFLVGPGMDPGESNPSVSADALVTTNPITHTSYAVFFRAAPRAAPAIVRSTDDARTNEKTLATAPGDTPGLARADA